MVGMEMFKNTYVCDLYIYILYHMNGKWGISNKILSCRNVMDMQSTLILLYCLLANVTFMPVSN